MVGRVDGLVSSIGVLVDADEAAQDDSQVGEADGLDDGQDDGALHVVASIVFAVGLAGTYMEVGEVAAISRTDGQCEAGEKGGRATRGRLIFQRGRGFAGAGEGYHLGSDGVRRLVVPVSGVLDIHRGREGRRKGSRAAGWVGARNGLSPPGLGLGLSQGR